MNSIPVSKIIWYIKTQFYRLRFGKIGKMTYIGRPTSWYGTQNIFIGSKVRIQPGCRLETHDGGQIIIEDNVSIGQNFHCTASGKLVIHKNTTVSGNVFITDIDHDYTQIGIHVLEQNRINKATEIRENCFIGFGAAIQAGTRLGTQCIIGTNAVVRGDYPDFSVIVGVPGRIVKQYNSASGKWERV